jgi:arsenate reductase
LLLSQNDKKKVLFVCIHNSARSQIAEEILRSLVGDRFEAESAGIEPGKLNPLVIEVLKEKGIDISGKETKSVFDIFKSGKKFDYVITVCDESNSERCPVFPGLKGQIHWNFEDPSRFGGSHQEKLDKTRNVRDKIQKRVEQWLSQGV